MGNSRLPFGNHPAIKPLMAPPRPGTCPADIEGLDMTQITSRILAAIARAGRAGCAAVDCEMAAYGDADGPEDPRGVVYQLIHRLKARGFIYALGRRYYHHTVKPPVNQPARKQLRRPKRRI